MVDSLRDMAVDKQTHRHTDKHSQLLLPLALWAGSEKSKEKSNSNMKVLKYFFIKFQSPEIGPGGHIGDKEESD